MLLTSLGDISLVEEVHKIGFLDFLCDFCDHCDFRDLLRFLLVDIKQLP